MIVTPISPSTGIAFHKWDEAKATSGTWLEVAQEGGRVNLTIDEVKDITVAVLSRFFRPDFDGVIDTVFKKFKSQGRLYNEKGGKP